MLAFVRGMLRTDTTGNAGTGRWAVGGALGLLTLAILAAGCGGGGSASVPTGPLVDYAACFTGKQKALAEENEATFRAGLHHPASVSKQPKGNLPTIEERFTAGVLLCSSQLLLKGKEAALKVEEERCADWTEDQHSVIKALAGQPAIDAEQRLVEYRVLCT